MTHRARASRPLTDWKFSLTLHLILRHGRFLVPLQQAHLNRIPPRELVQLYHETGERFGFRWYNCSGILVVGSEQSEWGTLRSSLAILDSEPTVTHPAVRFPPQKEGYYNNGHRQKRIA